MPRIYTPLPQPTPEVSAALALFNANTLRAAVIRDLAQHPEGDTTGNIAKRLDVDYRQVYTHIKTLESLGLVSASGAHGERNGQRVHYVIDLAKLQEQGQVYLTFLSGN